MNEQPRKEEEEDVGDEMQESAVPEVLPDEKARINADGAALLRIARDLREFVAEAPTDDADARAVRRDCDVMERIGNWLASVQPVTFSDGISTR